MLELRSTSQKTAPKPFTSAGSEEPGTTKETSVILEPIAVSIRWAENSENISGYNASMFPKSIGVPVGLDPFALTCKLVPGVEKITPRGESTLKKSVASILGAAWVLGRGTTATSNYLSINSCKAEKKDCCKKNFL